MENQENTPLEPNLSQYFSNDFSSYFDELTISDNTKRFENNQLMQSDIFQSTLNTPEYFGIEEAKDDLIVSDEVRNFWEPPLIEPGVPLSLTTPGVSTPTDLADPIQEAVKVHLDESELAQRKFQSANDVTQDERGLRILIAANCYRAAVNLTGRLLTIYGQGYGRAGHPAKHTPHSLQLWFTRFALLAKLGQYDILQTESEPFGILNKPDVYFEYYPEMYSGKKGSIAPFSFRLLLAEIQIYFGNPKLALSRLTDIAITCNEIKSYFKDEKQNYEFWKSREIRVLHSIVNCAIIMKDYCLVDDTIENLFTQATSNEEKRLLLSAWGRIYLQIGDVFGAEQKFSKARRLRENNSQPDLLDLVDKALVAVAQNNFQEAYFNFQKALQFDSGSAMLLNNMGVCLLYCGKLKDAINLFEKAVSSNPQKVLNENLLINLSTLYELESNNAKQKKLNLLKLLNSYKADLNMNLDICLKL